MSMTLGHQDRDFGVSFGVTFGHPLGLRGETFCRLGLILRATGKNMYIILKTLLAPQISKAATKTKQAMSRKQYRKKCALVKSGFGMVAFALLLAPFWDRFVTLSANRCALAAREQVAPEKHRAFMKRGVPGHVGYWLSTPKREA